jgi:hypothetical protein
MERNAGQRTRWLGFSSVPGWEVWGIWIFMGLKASFALRTDNMNEDSRWDGAGQWAIAAIRAMLRNQG